MNIHLCNLQAFCTVIGNKNNVLFRLTSPSLGPLEAARRLLRSFLLHFRIKTEATIRTIRPKMITGAINGFAVAAEERAEKVNLV